MTEKKPTLEYARPEPRRFRWHWWDNLFVLAILLILVSMVIPSFGPLSFSPL